MSTTIQFYQDKGHECSYLKDQQARNIYPDPNLVMSNGLYSQLIQLGFRRSGDFSYRPYCETCNACVPVRINTNLFTPNRSQRRCIKRNQDVSLTMMEPIFNQEHFDLYERYLAGRHINGGMDNPTIHNYMGFIDSKWSDTALLEFRINKRLIAIAVTDFVHDGASAFYTFFEPEFANRSLGTYAILQQIEMTKQNHRPYLYLGYWIKDCKKMVYKQNFSGLEAFTEHRWQPFEKIKTFE
jgi:arginine-tRNA-protein transferase